MLKKWLSYILKLRLEELIAILFLIPTWIITIKANVYFLEHSNHIPRKFWGGIVRLIVTMILMGGFFVFIKKKPLWKYTFWLRDVMPFLFCIAIYTNLHDTIHFVNPHDIHWTLIKIEKWIFGVQPVLWAQKFYHPWLTDYFSLAYMNYFYIAGAVVLYLLLKKDYINMRKVLLGTILTFYFGYFLYILFPAAPPRLVLANQFVRDFGGGWITATQTKIVQIGARDARAAFPSLHGAVTLISLMYAFKYSKKLFVFLLIPGISLILATIYLRHHYVVDLLAGFILAVFTYFVSPAIDRWYKRLQGKYTFTSLSTNPSEKKKSLRV